jgi:hypothetical protein
MAANKKAPASVGALTRAKTETFAGSQSDTILAQKIWDSLIKIWGLEHGLNLQVQQKGAGRAAV